MKKITKLIIPFSTIVLILIVLSWLWVFKQADDSVKNQKAAFDVEASNIITEFENDENLANQNYLGKVIIVSGILESVKESENDYSLYLKNSDDMSGVLCSFNKSAIDTTKLEVGQKVRIKGICTGYLIDVVLNKCVLVN